MAEVIKVIDIDGTAGQNGVDYTSVADWITDKHGQASYDLASLGVQATLKFRASAGSSYTTSMIIPGADTSKFVTSATCYIKFVPDTTALRTGPSWATGKIRVSVEDAVAVEAQVNHFWMDGFQLEVHDITSSSWRHCFVSNPQGTGWTRLSNTIMKGPAHATSYFYGTVAHTAQYFYQWNNIVFNVGPSGASVPYYIGDYHGYNYFAHCLAIGETSGYGFLNMGPSTTYVYCKNCYSAKGSGYNFSGIDAANLSHCAAAGTDANLDGSGGGNGGYDGRSKTYDASMFTNVTGGSENWHLKDASSLLYHQGVDISGDTAPMNVSTDMDGDSYYTSAPSIGVDEIVAAATARNQFMMMGMGQ